MEQIETEIARLKQEKNAVLLAHYYVPDEVQACADFVGDSFYLSRVAQKTDAETIVFCGVSFMGESAKILNPSRTVLMPEPAADCPMAHMADITALEALRAEHPDLAVVCYINSTAELKAHCDVCVTSSNALAIVRALPNREILFLPDENLGRHIASLVPEKTFYFQQGFCPVHKRITPAACAGAKAAHPGAPLFLHPECVPEAVALADFAGSTSEIISAAEKSSAPLILIGTDTGVLFELRRRCPDKRFLPVVSDQCCRDMQTVTLPKVLRCLRDGTGEVTLPEELRTGALRPLERMLELGR